MYAAGFDPGAWQLCWHLLGIALLLGSAPALADSGVSDERVSLPDGPGSVGGFGENLSAAGNQGALNHSFLFELPAGFAQATPELGLEYSSLSGSDVVGIGWSVPVPHIERLTRLGLPRYTTDDRFAVEGSEPLVQVAQRADGSRVFRARFEGSFVIYSWLSARDGKAGYWRAEYPDGTLGYFGADSAGNLVAGARATGPDGGVFRYMLVETLDGFGHRVRYHYEPDETAGESRLGAPLLRNIRYVFRDGRPRYEVVLRYEPREDVVSTGLPGFLLQLGQRLHELEAFVEGESLRRYVLRYEQPVGAGTSRLSQITQYGKGGEVFPRRTSFCYSAPLDLAGSTGTRPVVYEMGYARTSFGGGIDMLNGRATLLDINADALPDLLDTSDGQHRFFLNEMQADGHPRFSAPVLSRLKDKSFRLEEAPVQVADLNGDGLTDLFHAGTGAVLCNSGEGDWSLGQACRPPNLPRDLDSDDESGDADPRGSRFFDFDGDKRIDLLRAATADVATVWHNLPGQPRPLVLLERGLGRAFDQGGLQLADLNGDGLLDLVEITAGGLVWSRLYLGLGNWTPAVGTQQLRGPAGLTDYEAAELQDVNGDGLDDVVLVVANAVHIALNRAGRFLPFETLESADVDGGLPSYDRQTVSVVFADMNASGTTDIVWLDSSSGQVRVLELFATRPHLLTEIDNGVGGIERVTYGAIARQAARARVDGRPWQYPLPQALQVVTATERFTRLTPNVVQRESYLYRDGYYDGREKRYLGFGEIERTTPASASQQAGRLVTRYDLGIDDVYLQGRVLSEHAFTGEGEATSPLWTTRYHYGTSADECPLAAVGTRPPAVRFVCLTKRETVLQEGHGESEWLTLRERMAYDGYGNVVRHEQQGVVGVGPEARAGCGRCDPTSELYSGPCDRAGQQCLGDEWIVETQYAQPFADGRGGWNLGLSYRERAYSAAGGEFSETLTFYDGKAFVGLPAGHFTAGLVSRVCQREHAWAADGCEGPGWVREQRLLHDAHGQLRKELDPLGKEGSREGHLRELEYGAWGLLPTALTLYTAQDGVPYALRRETRYHPLFDQPSAVSRWMLVDAPVDSVRAETRIRYDAFGRRRALIAPPDSPEAPTREFRYELGPSWGKVTTWMRSEAGAEADLERIDCVDGFGRHLQSRTRLTPGRYQVSGLRELAPQGVTARAYQEYVGGASCEVHAPSHVLATRFQYDAAGRAVEVIHPAAAGQAYPPSTSRTEYAPSTVTTYDAEDLDPLSNAYQTPYRSVRDGLGRLVRLERVLSPGGSVGVTRLLWDRLGQLAGYVDAGGRGKRQFYDLLGRVTRVDDPNHGRVVFEYDAASNLRARIDARGKTAKLRYDGLNRLVSRLDPAAKAETRVRFGYDFDPERTSPTHAAGRRVWTSYPLGGERGHGQDLWGYDLRGQTVSFSRTLEGQSLEVTSSYDNAGRLRATRYPDGTWLHRQLDGAGRVTAVEDFVARVDYDPRGLPIDVTLKSGLHTQRSYDTRQRLSAVRTLRPNGEVVQGYTVERDRVGNVRHVEITAAPHHAREPAALELDYDAWYRPTRVHFDGGDSAVEQLHYSYDLSDRPTTAMSSLGTESRAHVGTYEYKAEAPGAVSAGRSLTLRYSDSGGLIQRGGVALERDYLGRVVRAAGGVVDADFAYDAEGQRVMKLEDGGVVYYVGKQFAVRDGVSEVYVSPVDGPVAVHRSLALAPQPLDAVHAPLADPAPCGAGSAYRAAAHSPARAQRLLRYCARRLLLEAEGPTRYLHQDFVGNLTLATQPDGRIRGEALYHAAGGVRMARGHVGARGFSGRERDASTGLIHFPFRELDPITARWASPDPAFLVSSPEGLAHFGEATTGYAYVANQWFNAVDPTGLMARSARGGKVQRAPKRARTGLRTRMRNRWARASHHGRNLGIRSAALASRVGVELGLAATRAAVATPSVATAGMLTFGMYHTFPVFKAFATFPGFLLTPAVLELTGAAGFLTNVYNAADRRAAVARLSITRRRAEALYRERVAYDAVRMQVFRAGWPLPPDLTNRIAALVNPELTYHLPVGESPSAATRRRVGEPWHARDATQIQRIWRGYSVRREGDGS